MEGFDGHVFNGLEVLYSPVYWFDNNLCYLQFNKNENKPLIMRKYKFTVILFSVLLLIPFYGSTQGTSIGSWRTHLPYNKVIDVVVIDDMVFAATELSIFTYNKLDNNVDRFDKVRGLNDIGISSIGYNEITREILVAYSNTNIDIITENGQIINIPDIKGKEILGKKTINNITFRDQFAYLSTGFGIVVLDMERREIADTYYIGPNGDAIEINSIAFNDTSILAATESGIYYADKNVSNLADFHQWTKDYTMLYPNEFYNLIASFNNRIYVNLQGATFGSDTMFVYNGVEWDYFERDNNDNHRQFSVSENNMLIVNEYNVTVYDGDMNQEYTIWNPGGKSIQPLSAAKGKEFDWVGDKSKGLIKVTPPGWGGEFIKPNGPSTNNVFELDAGGLNVWVASGGRQSNWAKLYMTDGVFSFVDETWKTYNSGNTPAMDTMSDYVCVKVDPANTNIVYVGTWQAGVLKFDNNELTEIYDENNSTLQGWIANPNLVNISGLDFDSQHNLWVANSGAPNLLSVMKNNGEWKSFNLAGSLSGKDISRMIVDNYDLKWIIKRSEGLLIVFSDGGTIDDVSDDKVKVLYSTEGAGNIPGNKVYAFASDMDGEVWVGTDKGIAVFYSPESIFIQGADYDAQRILVPRNDGSGLADYLLETELVTSIAVDGANRKWIGTERAGLFLFSEDGLEELEHFTTENSPLLSNNITSISINNDGEVFVGTAEGIISYKGTATPPQPPGSNVYAYPNPVREDYTGLIAIKGLVSDTYVKITDSYGNLVYQTTSEGGQAIWDGNNSNGEKVATGIYMVFAFTEDKTEKVVTKILVVN